MSAHRTVIFIGALLAALVAALPSSALASSLLSGYGGPGQGNQAILGSALVNGPRGGGGSGGSSGGSSTGPSEAATESSQTGTDEGSASSAGGPSAGGAGSAGGHHGHAGGASVTKQGTHTKSVPAGDSSASATLSASFYPAAERTPAGEGGALGLSGSDLVYIILGFAVLVCLGVLTGWLGRGRVSEGTRG